ncbi:hypothetical protein [Nonomuraea lactucae]|uniref:hypothetical protein n=1 Tax=Nonomuraea lactucae TaxID=2249762 RepID=UPI000DE44729|nr:hypothetical protein [Nonomuraea lactucae]
MSGVQFHHRSLLCWPELLTEEGRRRIRTLLHTGARVLSLGAPFPATVVADVHTVPLTVWTVDERPGSGGEGALIFEPGFAEWAELTAMSREVGLTPLAGSARRHPEWRHARVRHEHGLVAAASAQDLAAEVAGGPRRLVCSVMSAPAFRHSGAARRCVDAAVAGAGAAALVEPRADSGGFFARLGWAPTATAHLYRYR